MASAGDGLEELRHKFLTELLELGPDFVATLGQCTVQRYITLRAKTTDEALVVFDSVNMRDCVKAAAGKLSGKRAGMKIHIPTHLKASFRHLDNVCFNLKKKYPDLRRSIKYDDETMTLVADFKLTEDDSWQRLTADQAKHARSTANAASNSGPTPVTADSIVSLMSGPSQTS